MPRTKNKIIVGGALLIGLIFLGSSGFLHAQTASELQSQITERNNTIANLEAEIASYQKQLSVLAKDKDSLSNAIKTLNLEAQQLAANIKVTEAKISASNLKLKTLGSSIQDTSDTISELKDAIRKTLREEASTDQLSFTELLVSDRNIGELWNYAAQREAFSRQMQEKTHSLKDTRTVLEHDKSEVEKVKSDLLSLKSKLGDQRTLVQRAQSDKNNLLKATKNQEASYQKLVADKEALKKQFEAELRDYESRLKYVLDPSSIPKAGSGALAWPLDNIYITQYFGSSVSAKRLYTSGSHNGVDFRAALGTPVRSMGTGVVTGTGNTDITCRGASYGSWVLIQYDNGLSSLYGHLSLIKVASGQRVFEGSIVGYSGSTGYSTGPHLHLSLFPSDAVSVASLPSKSCNGKTYTMPVAATNAYLDPMAYLPKLR